MIISCGNCGEYTEYVHVFDCAFCGHGICIDCEGDHYDECDEYLANEKLPENEPEF